MSNVPILACRGGSLSLIHISQGIDPVYCGYSPENDLTHIEIDISKVPDTARFLWLQLTDGVGHKAWMNPYYLKD